jgi:UDP-2,4-diacetamido-2,4,6-trideoxy-beta-L-altropyranose hydrolase
VACSRVMVIDDLMNRMHFCDLLLDQNITAVYEVYKKLCLKENTQLLMGPEFALLRPEFEEKHNSVNLGNELRSIKKILVFFGASDVNGDCLKMAKSIPDFLSSYEFTFILNEQHADFNELKNILSKYSNIRLLSFVDNLADLMVDHDLFIGAGGTTSWERACLGMATALFSVADNQTPICEELGRRKISYYVGHSQLMTKAKWTAFFKQIVPDHSLWYDYRKEAFQLVDGKGVRKVVAAIEHINVKN